MTHSSRDDPRPPPLRPEARRTASAVGALALGAALLASAACAGGPPPGAGPSPALPAIPEVRGDLELYVAYPDSGDRIAASDSNFIFGSTGTGAAELTIEDRAVRVEPNGAFLAWLPVPSETAGDTARYRLVARAGDAVDTLVHPVRLPPRPYEGKGRVWVDTTALSDLPERWGPPEATLERTVRAASGLAAWLEVRAAVSRAGTDTAPSDSLRRGEGKDARRPGADSVARHREDAGPPAPGAGSDDGGVDVPAALRVPLRETAAGRYRIRAELGRLARVAASGASDGDSVAAAGDTVPAAVAPPEAGAPSRAGAARPTSDTLRLDLRVTDGRDTASTAGELVVRVLDPRRPPLATLVEKPDPVHGAAGRVAARPSPDGSYAWRVPPGSAAPVDRRIGERLRLRLGPDLHAWVAAEDAELGPETELPVDRVAPTATVGLVSADPRDDRVRVSLPVSRRVPAHVEAAGPRSLRLVVHGGLSATERVVYGPDDRLLRGLRWRQEAGPRWVLTVLLAEPVWGWDLRWEDRGDGTSGVAGGPPFGGDALPLPEPDEPGTLVLDLRRPPEIDPDGPLRGVRVAVDPGHPPVGAEGPTGLTEADANLAVARELVRLLEDAGAEPVLIRRDGSPVGLYERRRRAVAAGADVLVSVHNNALPDGVRPFGREGTSTYYFHPHARRLARHVQRGMLETMGLRDRGVRWGNLALPRESWMPSVLTEGAFMMFPRHEAALRTPAFREAYARGVLRGVRAFLAEHASRARRPHHRERDRP